MALIIAYLRENEKKWEYVELENCDSKMCNCVKTTIIGEANIAKSRQKGRRGENVSYFDYISQLH